MTTLNQQSSTEKDKDLKKHDQQKNNEQKNKHQDEQERGGDKNQNTQKNW